MTVSEIENRNYCRYINTFRISPYKGLRCAKTSTESKEVLIANIYLLFSSSCFLCSSNSSGLVNLRLRPLWLVNLPKNNQRLCENKEAHFSITLEDIEV